MTRKPIATIPCRDDLLMVRYPDCIGNDPGCPCQDGDACHYRDLPAVDGMPASKGWPMWQPVATIPCRDDLLMVRYRDGEEFVTDADHDSDPTWWAAQGATHWRALTERELDAYYTLGWK